MNPERRRLTVGTVDGGASGTRGGARPVLERDLDGVPLFTSVEEGKRAILLASKTDRDLHRRRSFAEKDTETMVPSGQDASANETWLNQAYGIGYACRKGLKPESPNQDSFFVLAVENQFLLCCVLDGHGPNGHDISNLARTCLLKRFFNEDFRKDPEKAFHSCFTGTQDDIEKQKDYDASSSGSTCSMTLYDFQTDKLTVAHVGDSRVVLGKVTDSGFDKDDALTEDHKPNLPAEKRRIESANPPGRVEFDGYYNYRVFAKRGSYPGLNMSRALGDVVAHKEAGLTAMPDTTTIDLKPMREKFKGLVLLACTDGVWEFIENQEALKLVTEKNKEEKGSSRPKEQIAAGELAKESYDRWMKDSDNEISDDITVVWTQL